MSDRVASPRWEASDEGLRREACTTPSADAEMTQRLDEVLAGGGDTATTG